MTFVTPINTGRPRRWSSEWLPAICILAVFVAVVSLPLMIGVGTWMSHLALRQEWAIKGPPCPEVAQISLMARGAKPPRPFVYKGTRFAAQIGNVFCEAVPDEGWFPKTTHAVCQFSNPSAIEVETPVRKAVYEVGIGHRATVTVRNGQPRCVIWGWFDY
jgi:hypothetical protein